MGKVFIDLNSNITRQTTLSSIHDSNRLVGTIISPSMFGINFLSSFDQGPDKNNDTYKTAIKSIANIDLLSGNADAKGLSSTIGNLRFPGGALTEQFFARPGAKLTINTPVDYNNRQGTSAADFIALCKDMGVNMTQVIPTWRYLDSEGLTKSDKSELSSYVTDLLTHALKNHVQIKAFELGNEYWGEISTQKHDSERMTAAQYGKIASQQAEVIQGAITEFIKQNHSALDAIPNWNEPNILLQIGSPSGDSLNIGREKAKQDTAAIIDAFATAQQRRAIDGFVAHRYESAIDHIRDPYVQAKPLHFAAIQPMLNDHGWKPFESMTLSVSEWNISQNSQETGLKSFAAITALMGEFASLGIDAADFWSVSARSHFPLIRGQIGMSYPSNGGNPLSFTGEAFRMLSESIIGKQSVALYHKRDGDLIPLDGNRLDHASGDNLRTNIEAFANDQELVLFLSNLSGKKSNIDLNLKDMLGDRPAHAWASLIASSSRNPLDANAEPVIKNFNLALSEGRAHNISLGSYQSIRITVALDESGANMLGYRGADILHGWMNNDHIEGRFGNDKLFGHLGDDSVFGGKGYDSIFGGGGLDDLFGGAGKDSLFGGNGPDSIFGGSGADFLFGGAGNDMLYGGSGADCFVFAGNSGHDTIYGFQAGVDMISLNGAALNPDHLHWAQVPGGVELAQETGDTVVLMGITMAQVLSGEVIFG